MTMQDVVNALMLAQKRAIRMAGQKSSFAHDALLSVASELGWLVNEIVDDDPAIVLDIPRKRKVRGKLAEESEPHTP